MSRTLAVVPAEIIVRPKRGTNLELSLTQLKPRKDLWLGVLETLPTGAWLINVDKPDHADEVVKAMRHSDDYLYVQPNHIYQPAEVPNDRYFPDPWALNNTG